MKINDRNLDLILIAAVAENNVIGNKGKIPWHIKEDMERFRELTLNHPVLMGRKTYESIIKKLGEPLDNRVNIMLSNNSYFRVYPEVNLYCDLSGALKFAASKDNVCYVIGGQRVYEQTIGIADKLEITEVHRDYAGDAFFPSINRDEWNETNRVNRSDYSFVSYQRKDKL